MANDGLLVVSFPALQQASADIQNALSKLQSQLAQAEQDARPLVSTWTGEAKEAYEQRQNKWRQAASDLSQILGSIRKAVDQSAADYQNAEKRNAGLFQ